MTTSHTAAVTDVPAIRSAVRFLDSRFAHRRCDHEAVSDCERCNVLFLVRKIAALLPAADEGAP